MIGAGLAAAVTDRLVSTCGGIATTEAWASFRALETYMGMSANAFVGSRRTGGEASAAGFKARRLVRAGPSFEQGPSPMTLLSPIHWHALEWNIDLVVRQVTRKCGENGQVLRIG